MRYRVLSVALAAAVLIGCGVSGEKLDEAEARIKTLIEQGVPDSLISEAKVQLMNARASLKTGNGALASQAADSMFTLIDAAEAWYQGAQADLGPKVAEAYDKLVKAKEGLTGGQLFKADSLLAVVDTLKSKNWMTQAHAKLTEYAALFEQLAEDEAVAAEVSKKIVGKWAGQEVSADRKLGLVKTKLFEFGKDGSFEFIEKEKGKHTPDFKTDWKIVSSGTYSLRGDTVVARVTNEKRAYQKRWARENGKWKQMVDPPYDSTFTDGRRDFTVTFSWIKEELKRVK